VKKLFVFFLMSFNILAFSQDNEETYYRVIEPKHSYTIDFALPVSVANKAFKDIMQGFVRASVSYQYAFKNHLNIGLGGNYTYFSVNRFKITPQILGGMHLYNAHVKIAIEKFYSERIGFDYGIKAGYTFANIHSDSLVTRVKITEPFIEPYLSFALSADHRSSYKWTLAYSFQNFGFSPQKIGLFQLNEYSEAEKSRITRFFSFGFSFTHYFKQRQ
jgi:hypothetical protein